MSTALLRPLRIRILESLGAPSSAATVAKVLAVPRQKVNYHLRELEREGLVELVEERKKGNCIERLVRATARSYLVGAEALAQIASDPEAVPDRFSSAYLVSTCARAIGEIAALRGAAESAGKRLPTLTLEADVSFGSAVDRAAFFEELTNALARLVAKYHDEKSPHRRRFRLFCGTHPASTPAKEEDQ